MSFLFIDTVSQQNKIYFNLFFHHQCIAKLERATPPFRQSEEFWTLLFQIFKKSNFSLQNLDGIVVVTGPGGFTASREGVSVANALAFALDIPVFGITKNQVEQIFSPGFIEQRLARTSRKSLVFPIYDKKPNITRSKNMWSK